MLPILQGDTGSPGIHAGRGLKHFVKTTSVLGTVGSPGIHAGRGLKLDAPIDWVGTLEDRPAFMPGVD